MNILKKIRTKILATNINPIPGFIPANLDSIFALLDGTAREICRLDGDNALQNAFWNE